MVALSTLAPSTTLRRRHATTRWPQPMGQASATARPCRWRELADDWTDGLDWRTREATFVEWQLLAALGPQPHIGAAPKANAADSRTVALRAAYDTCAIATPSSKDRLPFHPRPKCQHPRGNAPSALASRRTGMSSSATLRTVDRRRIAARSSGRPGPRPRSRRRPHALAHPCCRRRGRKQLLRPLPSPARPSRTTIRTASDRRC